MMNYFEYIQKYQYPAGPLPPTGDSEKDAALARRIDLYNNDRPLSGTDPVGEFYVSGVLLSPIFKGIGKGFATIGKRIFGNPTITQKVLEFVGSDSTRPRLTKEEIGTLPRVLQEEIKILESKGVDITKLSKQDLETALTKRWELLKDLSKKTRLTRSRPTAKGYEAEVLQNGENVGHISLSNSATNPRVKMIVSTKPGEGIGKDLYDAGIKTVQQDGYQGIISGENLVSPQKTMSTWKHYPGKELLFNNGLQSLDGTFIKETPVYLLNKPAGTTPVKSILFDPTIIGKDGVMHIDLSNKNILKAATPLWGIYQSQSRGNQ